MDVSQNSPNHPWFTIYSNKPTILWVQYGLRNHRMCTSTMGKDTGRWCWHQLCGLATSVELPRPFEYEPTASPHQMPEPLELTIPRKCQHFRRIIFPCSNQQDATPNYSKMASSFQKETTAFFDPESPVLDGSAWSSWSHNWWTGVSTDCGRSHCLCQMVPLLISQLRILTMGSIE